ncbi:hypothetical protein EMIHUDRAFT_449603 [Emiliania huxleyi CCMP1516]|uniref:DRTGG domain-containing protein n=2 Tax=Emiliania huxleyi TaxID=2903 RepID=A0A0D3K5B9_EMIH1|nr:hypothetical protein EMIHUDRAFT_449603 [Emiliania huxleyi CCMP1516]EOD30954.1 hypothetical protein EMIHUDRAFT_449603 [Emiliania huxleyi CCMP1516]|mmetsp:Transcript_18005/g.53358  ORF Transcript_18005/g.53358 Transcript_18005/m.53358 type:complete len:293 (-) Transcript_18005:305-1183(-)|eukprot:XP_005783383.1 hypothetical protein EMIHUDRAFT_449603 [Emiliania huxleyi CCMP1516]
MGGLRVLVAGDKSHAGKSTISLGLLGALLEAGYKPAELAYIKPATQCVSSTLTARFCEANGIACVHVGPLVFYRGFTRHFLDEHPDDSVAASAELVQKCAAAVESLSAGKRLTVIDGVGYPSVGSIVGCSSADLAVACGAPVLLVGKSGLGDAIDSFNLCARYFEAQRVPVLGAVFNRVPSSGFYGREKVSAYFTKYFETHRPKQRVYGLLPEASGLDTGAEESCSFAFKHPEVPPPAGPMSEGDEAAVKAVGQLFADCVDMTALLQDLDAACKSPDAYTNKLVCFAGTDAA